jgi:hypothetical protein
VLIRIQAWPHWLANSGHTGQELTETVDAAADFVAGPVNQRARNSAEESQTDGLTLRIIEFFADETRTVVGYEIEGREDEGRTAGPAGPPSLIDATGKTYRTIGATGGSSVQGRQATVVFPPVKPEAGSISSFSMALWSAGQRHTKASGGLSMLGTVGGRVQTAGSRFPLCLSRSEAAQPE